MTIRHRATTRSALIAAGLLVVLTGCGTLAVPDRTADDFSNTGSGYPVSVTNCGRAVSIPAPPVRVVSMHPSITELLVQLDLGDRVVAQAQDGLGEPSPELAVAVKRIPSLSVDTPPTREVLLAQQPDLVISGTEYEFNTEMGFAGYDNLEAAGSSTYVATAGCKDRRSRGTVADTFEDLRTLGVVFGVQERAAEVEREARAQLQAVADIVGDTRPVRAAQVYVEGGKLYAVGGAVEIDVLRIGGGENLFAADGRFADFFAAEVNPEVILDKRPDALVFAVNDAEHEAETRAFLRKNLADTPAVHDDRLVAVDNTYVQPGTLSAITGARIVAEGLHR
ncbi:ABC transporter substrate-binding protein [Rhodococcus sp. 1168]|uniref:ABC transporter substrate-binding protein n=1 Tax=Rhodococcus sp. 1168 TaxID=2018041 RepID=UPI000A0AE1CD|nr:ABC transporter substrate-binding protein [Rhodococcus sp. 1168]ORI27052.1 ABC transporter substrate-binding protein [Rhodococcus sp. 1168]